MAASPGMSPAASTDDQRRAVGRGRRPPPRPWQRRQAAGGPPAGTRSLSSGPGRWGPGAPASESPSDGPDGPGAGGIRRRRRQQSRSAAAKSLTVLYRIGADPTPWPGDCDETWNPNTRIGSKALGSDAVAWLRSQWSADHYRRCGRAGGHSLTISERRARWVTVT